MRADRPAKGVRVQIAERVGQIELQLVEIDSDLRRAAFLALAPELRLQDDEHFVGVLAARVALAQRFAADRAIAHGHFGHDAQVLQLTVAPAAPNFGANLGRRGEAEIIEHPPFVFLRE